MFRSEGFLKYFKNFSWLFADRVLRLGLVLVTTIFVSRYLGADRVARQLGKNAHKRPLGHALCHCQ